MKTSKLNNLKVIFIHIPKTAGMTINYVLKNEYNKGYFRFDIENLDDDLISYYNNADNYSLLTGHFSFGFHKMIKVENFEYFTFLRDPVKMILSLYYYIRSEPSHPLHILFNKENFSINDIFLKTGNLQFDNSQVRMISGKGTNINLNCVTNDHLEIAKNNLKTKFKVFGLTDKFDESLVLLEKSFSWGVPHYVNQNVSKHTNIYKKISQNTKDIIIKYNQKDIELYKYASKLFDSQIETFGRELFSMRLKEFRSQNIKYNARFSKKNGLGWKILQIMKKRLLLKS